MDSLLGNPAILYAATKMSAFGRADLTAGSARRDKRLFTCLLLPLATGSAFGAQETGRSRLISPSRSGALGWPSLARVFLSSRWNRGFGRAERRQRRSTETTKAVADADHSITDQAVFRGITAAATPGRALAL
jgi:hypothetical protein